ncbi:TraX family protein [uncultured Clostridium sp.]|uniref:TraX family protein n=1 Tax=uncultured Clostridium sp. TaxID=59620 RepID=UPI002584B684|nr:TraX family protein [uncultured Clostridium sp.]
MDRFKIKIILVLLFILGSIARFIPHMPFWLNYPGVLVMPVVIFLIVDGYYHTTSLEKYIKRLMIGGEILLIGNFIISLALMKGPEGRLDYSNLSSKSYAYIIGLIIIALIFLILNFKDKCLNDGMVMIFIFVLSVGTNIVLREVNFQISILGNNMFLVLAGILVLLKALDESKNGTDKRSIIKVLIVFAICIFTETSIIGPAFAFIIYEFRNNKRMIVTGLFVLSGLLVPGFTLKALLAAPQWMMFFGIIFILLYNEKEGVKIKKPFYFIYPLCLWIPFIIGALIS